MRLSGALVIVVVVVIHQSSHFLYGWNYCVFFILSGDIYLDDGAKRLSRNFA